MNDGSWLPSLIVLAAGLGAGLFAALRLRGQRGAGESQVEADTALKLRDLEARRDDLYRRLRGAAEEGLSDSEREGLEQAAARTLHDIDRLQGMLPPSLATDPKIRPAAPEGEKVTAAPTRRPMLTGFLYGAGLVVVVALLVYFAVKDARPKPENGGPMASAPAGQPPHEVSPQASPELLAQIGELQGRIASHPDDWQARKALALALLAAGDFFEAFSQASEILQQFPDDPDGLLVHGVVRLSMGQATTALDRLDRVLAQYPDHRQAMIYRGLALYQLGNRQQAMDTWEMGLEMAGGTDADFQELLALAEAGVEIATPGPTGTQPSTGPDAVASTASQPAAATAGAYTARIEMGVGQPQTGGVLFVFLRPADGGPPVAAQRIVNPAFPLVVRLSAADSMMGDELPDNGVLVARLDTDGSVSTTTAGDLAAETNASIGDVVQLTLAD